MASRGSLGSIATIGVAWLMAQSLTVRVLTFLSQIVLTWLLSPADFGLVGLAATVLALSGALMNFGIDEVLLQRQHSLARWASCGFWMSMAFGVATALMVVVAAPFIARVYETPHLQALLIVQASALPLWSIQTVSYIQFRAQLRFGLQAAVNTADMAVTQALIIVFAWLGFGAMSFVIPLPIVALARAVVLCRLSPIKLFVGLKLFRLKYLAVNGLNVFISRSLNELILNGGYIVLGLTATNTVVGLYYFAFRLAAQPVRIMAGNFHYVLFPALAQLRTDQAQQGATALQAARVLAAVVMPLCFLQAALADPVLHIIASAQWHDSIPMAQILSLGLPFDAVSWIALALINARGQFKRSLIFTAVSSASFLALAGAGALIASGIGVSVAVSLYYTLQGPIYSKLVFGNATTFRRLIGDVYGLPALISGVSIGFAYALSLAPFLHDAQIARFLLIAALGLGMNLLIFWRVRPVLLAEIIRRLGGGRFARIAGMKRLSAYLGTPG